MKRNHDEVFIQYAQDKDIIDERLDDTDIIARLTLR